MTEYVSKDEAKVISLMDYGVDNVESLLEKEYVDIYEALSNDEYSLDYPNPQYLMEVVYEGKIVGFYTTKILHETIDQYTILDFYIMPEFRGNNIFVNTLMDLWNSNKDFLI